MSWQCGKFSVISIYFLSFHHWFLYIFRSYFVACFVVVLVKSIVFRRNDKMKENENEPSVIVSIDEAANGDDKKGFSSEKKKHKMFQMFDSKHTRTDKQNRERAKENQIKITIYTSLMLFSRSILLAHFDSIEYRP